PEDRFPSAVEFLKVIRSWAEVADPEESGPLTLQCPRCVSHVSPSARRCPQCGESLVSAAPISGPGFYKVSSKDIVQDVIEPSAWTRAQEHVSGDGPALGFPPVSVELGPAPDDWFVSPMSSQAPFFGHRELLEKTEAELILPDLRCLRVVGPPGQGKRRLAGTLLGRLVSEGRRGILVQPDPGDAPEPLGAAHRAATALLDLPCEPMSLEDLLQAGKDTGLDEATVYGLADLFSLGKPGGVTIDERRQRRARAWQTLVTNASRQRPLALLFEDLDRMDGATRELVISLAAAQGGPAVVLLATHQPEHVALWPSAFRELRLGAMEGPDLEEFALELSDGRLGDAEISRVVTASKGNPLHLQQAVAFLISHPEAEFPRGLADLIAVRAGRLPPALLGVLQAAAVLGDLVDEESLQLLSASSGWVNEAVAALASRAFLSTGSEGVRFVHPYLRQVVYAAIPAGIRAALHGEAARHLRQIGARREQIAHHLWHAEDLREEALPLLIGAGEWALSLLEEESAVLAFRRALKLLPRPSPATSDPDLRAAWVRSVGGLVEATDRSGDQREARLLLASALEEASAAGWHAERTALAERSHG
ncbi:MAG: AAA family ATPase, partial [Polyangia bacterium]|nr:AAA family ATPase [Polyangia bacterium]